MIPKKSIEYATEPAWNPFTGCRNVFNGKCAVGTKCWGYGMARRLAGRYGYPKDNPFQPTFHPDKLLKPLSWTKPHRVATSFMGDIAYARQEWMEQIFEVIRQTPQHIYYFLTKCPEYLTKLEFPDNAYIGVTVNRANETGRIADLVNKVIAKVKVVSFEPLYEEIRPDLRGISWIWIGSQTRPSIIPSHDWVATLVRYAQRAGCKIFMKNNLFGDDTRDIDESGLIQELLWGRN